MSGDQLTALKEQLAGLSWQEKLELARFLEQEAARGVSASVSQVSLDPGITALKRDQHMAWLKAHRELRRS